MLLQYKSILEHTRNTLKIAGTAKIKSKESPEQIRFQQ